MKWITSQSLFCLVLSLFVWMVPRETAAQLAPTGSHYAGRASDTGHGGTRVNATGGYGASIPLDLPAERAGLPVPLQIVYGGRGVGAAGLGWDIPLSYIKRDRTLAHRRPAYGSYVVPEARERVYLSFLGQGIELISNGQTWVARNGTLELTVRESSGTWLAYDGESRTYTFIQPVHLANTDLWLLASVSVAGVARVQLTYQVTTSPINGGAGIEINLSRITYNNTPLHPHSCAKHEIELTYGNYSTTPLSLSMLGDKVVVRTRTLEFVDVKSRATCAASAAFQRLRRYELQYLPDEDTLLPRLRTVRMLGREGTPEEHTALPVASYEYGTATRADEVVPGKRILRYEKTQTIDLPPDDADASKNISGTAIDSSVVGPPPIGIGPSLDTGYAMWHSLTDITGDGRPDLVFKKDNKLWVALNQRAAGGTTTLGGPVFGHGPAIYQLSDATFAKGAFSTHTATKQRFQYGTANRNTINVWRQAIDVNGDGRIDIIDAAEEPGTWVVYLNTPGGSSGIKWERRSFSVYNLGLELVRLNHVLDFGLYVPLSRRTTGVSTDVMVCLKRNGTKWDSFDGTVPGEHIATDPLTLNEILVTDTWKCDHGNPTSTPLPPPPYDMPGCILDFHLHPVCPSSSVEPEKTFVEWELSDLNGDGYPDFVFNSSPVEFVQVTPDVDIVDDTDHSYWIGKVSNKFTLLPPTNQIRASFNVVGVRFQNEPNPFSMPVSLAAPGSAEYGVGMWESDNDTHVPCQVAAGLGDHFYIEGVQCQVAGLADVNGDGLVDRVVNRQAYLGTADGFSSVYLTLPGLLSVQESGQKQQCKDAPGLVFTSQLTQGLRDLTGDGIPDYYDKGLVSIGTGTGFVDPAAQVVSVFPHFAFSHQTESCYGDWSNTDGGLFDIDGDGKPEVIGLVPVNGHRAYVVSQLAAGSVPRTPEAGRLTVVDNGYGARTRITYQSAKEEQGSSVPFPEIVVTSVETVGTLNLGGTLSGARYAYGGAELVFDSALDAFTFAGYQRSVEVRPYSTQAGKPESAATVIDTWPLTSAMTKQDRWRYTQRVGRVRDIYTLGGGVYPNPWSLLDVDANDPRVIGVTHHEWDAKLYEEPGNPFTRDCLDMVNPLNYEASFLATLGGGGFSGFDVCRAHGFAFWRSTESWYGPRPPPATTSNVQTRAQALEVDDFGRVGLALYEHDRFRSDDDVCVANTFAKPNPGYPRVLTALASRQVAQTTVTVDAAGKPHAGCSVNGVIFASESWEYDGLPAWAVSNGRMTSHTVDRRATDTGALLRTVRAFDATYNAAGNLATVRTERDGATRTVSFGYDPFGLVPTEAKVDATSVPSTESSVSYDPVSLEPISSTDANQTERGTAFDGFGRLIRSTVTPPGGPVGVVSTTGYDGFSGADPEGRRISIRQFSDPLALSNVATAAGRTHTVFFDELGRERRTELSLGSDYANEVLIAGSRTYDSIGRITFVADPYPMSQDPMTAYGTSYHFKNSGDVNCIIRGRGHQPLNMVTDVATERFPTCFVRSFFDHVVTDDVRDPASLQAGSPQEGVVKRVVSSAIGRLLEQSTVRGGTRLEHATYAYDRLGQQTAMTRFLDPVGGTNPVYWSWHLDSIGQMLQLEEPETATRAYTYSDWGELIQTQWTDGAIDRRLMRIRDARGRLIATKESNNGVVDPETVNKYTYDVGVNVSPLVTPTSVLGQLASASSQSMQVAFSYDAFGRVNARTFIDHHGGLYIEKTEHHADGSPAVLEFNLPDQGYDKERVTYAYDSAGRIRTMTHAAALGTRELYRAEIIDPFGRVRKAFYGGNTTYQADYADEGRRLMSEATVESSSGSRRVIFLSYDPLGREVSRREINDGAASGSETHVAYDALGRLATAVRTSGAATPFNWKFGYDALGNTHGLIDVIGPSNTALSYGTNDRDRLCHIGYGSGGFGGTACNVVHDVLGNVVHQPTRTGSRRLSYFSSGGIRTITEQGTQARFAYDAFGQVQELDVQGGTNQDQRHDRRYGELIERRDTESGGSTTSFVTRHIPGPGGIVASRRGPGDEWVFEFGELRGSRFFTDQDGKFIQDVEYQPFGESTSTGTPVGARNYTSYQWNGGDALAAFGLSHLGARIYDPIIGRFLSRDPLLIPRTAATTNPYAFAMNDPMNGADPSGLDCIEGQRCPWESSGPDILIDLGTGVVSGVHSGASAVTQRQAPRVSAGPQTREGKLVKRYMVENGISDSDTNDWDALAAMKLPYEDLIARLRAQNATWYPREGLNSVYNLVGSIGAGFGDFSTLGGTSWLRNDVFGGFHSVDESSGGYLVGEGLSLLVPWGALTDVVSGGVKGLRSAKVASWGAIGSTGRIGENALKALGGESQVFFRTTTGRRFVDQLVNGIAHESKVGYTSLTKKILTQIGKDAELIGSREIQGSVWHFFRSPVTGLIGPSAPLRQALEDAGIGIVIH